MLPLFLLFYSDFNDVLKNFSGSKFTGGTHAYRSLR